MVPNYEYSKFGILIALIHSTMKKEVPVLGLIIRWMKQLDFSMGQIFNKEENKEMPSIF